MNKYREAFRLMYCAACKELKTNGMQIDAPQFLQDMHMYLEEWCYENNN